MHEEVVIYRNAKNTLFYETADNGGVSFLCKIDLRSNEVYIYAYCFHSNEYVLVVQIGDFNDIFIGNDEDYEDYKGTRALKNRPSERLKKETNWKHPVNLSLRDGNSILIELKDREYVYVGTHISTFKTKEPIVYYFSPFGGTTCPNPYALSDKYSYYMEFMEDDDPNFSRRVSENYKKGSITCYKILIGRGIDFEDEYADICRNPYDVIKL